jgi:hypothetical protein
MPGRMGVRLMAIVAEGVAAEYIMPPSDEMVACRTFSGA